MPIVSQPSIITSSSQIAPNSVETADITNDAVTNDKLAAGTDGALRSYDTNGDPADISPGDSGKFLMSNGAGAVPTYETAAKDWEQLGETTLGSAASSISVAGFSARKDLLIIADIVGKDGSGNPILRFNSDSGNNYGFKGFRDTTAGSGAAQSEIELNVVGELDTTTGEYLEMRVQNSVTGRQKIGHWLFTEISGTAATVLAQDRGIFVWENTSAQITTVTILTSANNFLTGTRLTVYGKKD